MQNKKKNKQNKHSKCKKAPPYQHLFASPPPPLHQTVYFATWNQEKNEYNVIILDNHSKHFSMCERDLLSIQMYTT